MKAYLLAEEDSALGCGGASPGTTTALANNLASVQTPIEDAAAAVASGGGATMQGEQMIKLIIALNHKVA